VQWKEALDGNNKGQQNKVKDEDQMQVDTTCVETNQTKNKEVNFIQLAHLTLKEHIKLAKEGRCFRCHNTEHISRNCDKNTNPQVGNQTQNFGHPDTIKAKTKGGAPIIILRTLPHTHAPPTQNPPLL